MPSLDRLATARGYTPVPLGQTVGVEAQAAGGNTYRMSHLWAEQRLPITARGGLIIPFIVNPVSDIQAREPGSLQVSLNLRAGIWISSA